MIYLKNLSLYYAKFRGRHQWETSKLVVCEICLEKDTNSCYNLHEDTPGTEGHVTSTASLVISEFPSLGIRIH